MDRQTRRQVIGTRLSAYMERLDRLAFQWLAGLMPATSSDDIGQKVVLSFQCVL